MKHNKLPIAMLALVLPFLLSLACGSSGPPAIGDVVTAKSLDADYKPIGPISNYQPEDTFYVSVQVTDLVVGNTVKIQYKLNGELYEELTLTAKEEGTGYYGFSLKPSDTGHMPGSYTAEIYLNGVLAKTVAFTVEGDAQAQIVDVALAKSLDADNKPINLTTTFNPSDTVHVSVRYKNVKSGTVIKAVLNFAGNAVYQASTNDISITADKMGAGIFDFAFTPPVDGFAVGDYTMEVFLNGAPYANNPLVFTVAE